jgi:hypothetical protein
MTVHPFDLQARAGLAAISLTRLLDPERDGLIYFLASWQARPPRADHGLWDCGDGSGRLIDALTLVRRIVRPGAAAARPDRGETQIEGWMIRLLGRDGLTWLPREPWARPWGAGILLQDGDGDEQLAELSWAQRGTLLGLTSRYLAGRVERYLRAGRALVDGMLAVAQRHPDGLFFPEGYYRRGGWRRRDPGLSPGLEEYNAAVLVSAVRFYAATGYAPALELADGLARFALRHTGGYRPDGRLRGARGDSLLNHFHTRSNFILGILELGALAGRREYLSWARQSYERAREWGTDFGWFPEGLGCRHGEICGTTDMIEIAIGLGFSVDPAYFADAERFGRNHLLESQYLAGERLRQAVSQLPAESSPPPDEGRYSTTRGVVESQVGGFASRSTLNDALHLDAPAMMQCCNAAGARGIYDLWRYAVEEQRSEDGLPARQVVHMRFSVETPALQVVSHEPGAGRLEVTPKAAARIAVRLPVGDRHAVVAIRSGPECQVHMLETVDGYVSFDAQAGQKIELHYPLAERVADYEVGRPGRSLRCTAHWRGESVMRVEPAGPLYPLYQNRPDLPPVYPALPAVPLIDSLCRPNRMAPSQETE